MIRSIYSILLIIYDTRKAYYRHLLSHYINKVVLLIVYYSITAASTTGVAVNASNAEVNKKKRKTKFWKRKSSADLKVSGSTEEILIFIGNDQYRPLSAIPRGRRADEPYHVTLQKSRTKGLGLKLELDAASQSFKITKFRSSGTINKKEDLV